MGSSKDTRPLPDVVTRTRHPVKRVFHALLSLAGWIIFVWYWVTVFARPIDRAALQTFGALLVALLGIVAIHLLWVRFNVGIYRSRGQRTRVREVTFAGTRDQLGRELIGADWPRVQGMGHIVIDLTGSPERKVYMAGSLGPGSPEPGSLEH